MVYILKFSVPIAGRAQYYIGYCEDNRLSQRLAEHRSGTGAALTRAANGYGIDYEVIHTFPGASRAFERSLKRRKCTPRIVERLQRGTFRRPGGMMMATLIAVYTSDGCVGRCDAKCYGAVNPDCTCICGGVNHGVGFQQACENTSEMAEEWMKEYQQQHDEPLRFKQPVMQRTLFGEWEIVSDLIPTNDEPAD